MINVDTCILIDCPDAYLDILSVFFLFFEKNFKGCPFPVIITTQTKTIETPNGINVCFVRCGFGNNSIERASLAVNKYKYKYFIVLDCDCFIFESVDTDRVVSLINYMKNANLNYIRLWQTKNKEQIKYRTKYENLYFCNLKARYSKSLMINIWERKAFVDDVINSKLNGWEIEKKWLCESSETVYQFDSKYCYYNFDVFHILHSVYKGKWIKSSYKKCLKEGIDKNYFDKRAFTNYKENFKITVSNFFNRHFSSRTILKIKKIVSIFFKFESKY